MRPCHLDNVASRYSGTKHINTNVSSKQASSWFEHGSSAALNPTKNVRHMSASSCQRGCLRLLTGTKYGSLMPDEGYGEGAVHCIELLLGRRPTIEDDNGVIATMGIQTTMAIYAKNSKRCNNHHLGTRNTLLMDRFAMHNTR